MSFRFRQFTIEDEQSTLRVGTDSMLLGSWADPGNAKRILDIGTGCGVLALMMAQKSDAEIEAIDIDQASQMEALMNFSNSPWSARLKAIHESVQTYAERATAGFDFIITNPPYFSNSLKSQSLRMNRARHDDSLSFTELAGISSRLLTTDGILALILPTILAERLQLTCKAHGLFLSRSLKVSAHPATSPKRTLMEFTKNKINHPATSDLTIRDSAGKFMSEYLALTGCFHNF
jgi:tRNA1Val (adenine37-N6)-methyltransferase